MKLTFGSSLPTGVTKGSTNEAIVSITDDDVPSVEVSFGEDSYTVDEGSTVTVKVKLDADPERTVIIPITKANQGTVPPPATTPACPQASPSTQATPRWTSPSAPLRTRTTTTGRA